MFHSLRYIKEVVTQAMSISDDYVARSIRFVSFGPVEFSMGTSSPYDYRFHSERPAHLVRLTQRFWIADCPVTEGIFAIYSQAVGRPLRVKSADAKSMNVNSYSELPLVNITWYEARDLANFVAAVLKMPVRLPTEAEWEYCCRAGIHDSASIRKMCSTLEFGWHRENSGDSRHPVRQKKPNPYGLYDMWGNVLEWCEDWFSLYSKESISDPIGQDAYSWGKGMGEYKVARGNAFVTSVDDVSCTFRLDFDASATSPTIGLRLAMTG